MKRFIQVAALVATVATSAEARWGRWVGNQDNRAQGGQQILLGNAQIGGMQGGMNASLIDLGRNPQVNCNITHIRLTALGENAMITRIDVEYMRPDAMGNNRDSIDLRDDDDYGRAYGRHGMGGQGIMLQPNQPTVWLDVDDVQDGQQSGRCIRSLQIYGIDTPDRGPGMGGGRFGGGGFGGRFGGRPGFGGGRFGGGDNRPAIVQVDGLIQSRGGFDHGGPGMGHGGGGFGGHGGPGMGPGQGGFGGHGGPGMGPGQGGPGQGGQGGWYHRGDRSDRNLVFTNLGTTGLVKGAATNRIDVGVQKGRFDGIHLIAKDDNFQVEKLIVTFGDMSRAEFGGFSLGENRDTYIDFDWNRSGFRDQDRYIQSITVVGGGPIFGSKAQLIIEGGR